MNGSYAENESGNFRSWAGSANPTLYLVFTDIVRSMDLWIELGNETMNEVRREHFKKARAYLQQEGGFEIKTLGDGFLVAFKCANSAIQFASTLIADPGDDRLSIRAGIHVGRVIIEEEDAFGTTVNLASRASSLADGGEVFVSEAVMKELKRVGSRELQFVVTNTNEHNRPPLTT
jgi:class 3 adenylate cyclase